MLRSLREKEHTKVLLHFVRVDGQFERVSLYGDTCSEGLVPLFDRTLYRNKCIDVFSGFQEIETDDVRFLFLLATEIGNRFLYRQQNPLVSLYLKP